MSTEHQATPPMDLDSAPRWLRVNEVAAIARVTPRTIRRWVSVGFLRVSKPAGGRVLVDRDSLRAFIEGAAT